MAAKISAKNRPNSTHAPAWPVGNQRKPTAAAVGFRWFPTGQAGAWVLFGLFFALIFAAITGGIELYYRLSGRKWDDRLDWYRRNRDK